MTGDQASRRPVALIGYRGAGKTAVARELAALLAGEAVDADVLLEERAGRSIAEIFAVEGEAAFRDLEAELLAELVQRERTVLALGGGVVLRPANRELLRRCQAVVWLRASVETLAARLAADPTTAARRPALTAAGPAAEIERVLAERTPLYAACATFAVETEGRTPVEIARSVMGQLGLSVTNRNDP